MINIVKSGKINTNNLGEDNIMKQNLRLSKSEKEIMEFLKRNFHMKIMQLRLLWLIQQQIAEKS